MPKFLVLYESSVPPREMVAQATPEQMQAGMQAWNDWFGKAGSSLADMGSPVAAVGDANARVTGFSILQADSADEAQKLVENHPHLGSPGEPAVAVYEFLPMPGS